MHTALLSACNVHGADIPYNLLTRWVWGVGATKMRLTNSRQLAPSLTPPPLVLREANGMVVAYGVGHTCVLTYLVVVK